jgi:hypothetical protein
MILVVPEIERVHFVGERTIPDIDTIFPVL